MLGPYVLDHIVATGCEDSHVEQSFCVGIRCSHPLPLPWSHFGDILLLRSWVWPCDLPQPVKNKERGGLVGVAEPRFLSSFSSTLAVVWGHAEVTIPFISGSWNATSIWRTAALKSVLNQVSLSEE